MLHIKDEGEETVFEMENGTFNWRESEYVYVKGEDAVENIDVLDIVQPFKLKNVYINIERVSGFCQPITVHLWNVDIK